MADTTKSERPRVLVVDDDALMGAFIGDVLKDYRITFCQSATGAIGRVQAGGTEAIARSIADQVAARLESEI
jgi:hypothetical protein